MMRAESENETVRKVVSIRSIPKDLEVIILQCSF